jgi:glycerol-3-phosphate dehydrogenase (NAD(P)+)
MVMIAEGVATARSVVDLAKHHHAEMAIFQEVYNIMHEGKEPHQATEDLMSRSIKGEH